MRPRPSSGLARQGPAGPAHWPVRRPVLTAGPEGCPAARGWLRSPGAPLCCRGRVPSPGVWGSRSVGRLPLVHRWCAALPRRERPRPSLRLRLRAIAELPPFSPREAPAPLQLARQICRRFCLSACGSLPWPPTGPASGAGRCESFLTLLHRKVRCTWHVQLFDLQKHFPEPKNLTNHSNVILTRFCINPSQIRANWSRWRHLPAFAGKYRQIPANTWKTRPTCHKEHATARAPHHTPFECHFNEVLHQFEPDSSKLEPLAADLSHFSGYLGIFPGQMRPKCHKEHATACATSPTTSHTIQMSFQRDFASI